MEHKLDHHARKALIKQCVLEPMLSIFSRPRGMGDNKTAEVQYLKAIFEAINGSLPTQDINRDSFIHLLEKISNELITSSDYRVWYLPATAKKVARKHGQAYVSKTKADNAKFDQTIKQDTDNRADIQQAHLNGWTLAKCEAHFQKISDERQAGFIGGSLANTMEKFPRVAMRRLFRAILNNDYQEAIPASLQEDFIAYQEEIAQRQEHTPAD